MSQVLIIDVQSDFLSRAEQILLFQMFFFPLHQHSVQVVKKTKQNTVQKQQNNLHFLFTGSSSSTCRGNERGIEYQFLVLLLYRSVKFCYPDKLINTSPWLYHRSVSCLTDNIWMIDPLQELCLSIQALLVNRHLLGCTPAVDLLDSPGRRIQLSHSKINLINKKTHYRVTCFHIILTQTWKRSYAVFW